MKKLALVIVITAFFIQFLHAQDTVKHIRSLCLSHIIKSESDTCPEGIHFRYLEDTLEIYGTIWANCCGSHFVKIKRTEGTIYITSFDTGQLCNCVCEFCFDIKIPDAANDTFVNINEVVYNARKLFSIQSAGLNLSSIELYPNPAENIINLIVPVYIRTNRIEITDLTGRVVKNIENISTVIDINNLEAGTYFVKFYLDNKQAVTKIIVKK